MRTPTKWYILGYIRNHAPVTAKQIAEYFDIYSTITHRHLKDLIEQWHIEKRWTPPKVYYFPSTAKTWPTWTDDDDFLDAHFLVYDKTGRELIGKDGFAQRCHDRWLNFYKTLASYKELIHDIDNKRDDLWYIDATSRFRKQFDEIYIDGLRLLEVNQLKQFGKSKLGNLTYYAKQSQSLRLTKQVVELTKDKIHRFIKKHNIDGFCYAPPSLTRSPQLMDELEKGYNLASLWLKRIGLTKIFASDVKIPQKSIKGNKDRIANANNTIYLEPEQPKVKNLLLIDDFIASGATINISAKKIRDKWLADKIYAIGLLWNIDFDYEVINEV